MSGLVAETASRYVIGIDLGTTHCALSFVDTEASDGETARLDVLPIPQLSAPGEVEPLPLLPSFTYLPHETELAPGDLDLPWGGGRRYAVGTFARVRGAGTPIRMVASAKSWLCHAGVDRRGPILPVDAPEEVARISPFEASVRYLSHLRDAWNAAHPEALLSDQDVTVTIPASFDPVARELTADAARSAGYTRLTLLEEPQAALYSWIQNSAGGWRKQVKPGDVMLVVDIGGGTTDLSLIAIVEHEGQLEPHRVAVGEHILLGGDNMDLALAYGVVRKLGAQGTRLDAWQTRALSHACRAAKETLLGDAGTDVVPLVVPSRGSKLIGGSIRTELTRAELNATLLEGFFPQVGVAEHPQGRARGALTQVGLPYAQDAAITRHLAAFLTTQREATATLTGFAGGPAVGASFLHPSVVLFNGGVLKSGLLADRLMNTLNAWLAAEGAAPACLLDGAELDLAVSRGAAYYGYVRRGRGVRIRGGTARAYYVGVESSMPAVPGMEPPVEALCLAPFGMEEGSEAALPAQAFGLVVGEPVRFRFFASSVRRTDEVGTLLDMWATEELDELDGIEATLPAEGRSSGEIVRVRLHARVTEAGTLELEALPLEGDQRWRVELEMRGEAAGQ